MASNPDALLLIHSDICADVPIVDLVDFHATVSAAPDHLTVSASSPACRV
jgi:hypothetical protein